MKKASHYLPTILVVCAILAMAYAAMVNRTVQLRMSRVADRTEALLDLEKTVQSSRVALAALDQLPKTPLPDVDSLRREKIPGLQVDIKEAPAVALNAQWRQRRKDVTFTNCSLHDVQAWLKAVQRGAAGWRVLSVDIQAESASGRASGHLQLVGVEPIVSGGLL